MPDTDGPEENRGGSDPEVPDEVLDEAERLTRLARDAVDENEAAAYREARADLLADCNFTARVREEERATLVVYPSEWVVDGTVRPDLIEDVDRGIERPLEGPGETDEWGVVADHNREIAREVTERHGDVHGANAEALAAFASNHYAKPIDDLTRAERQEFLTEFFPRNAFPSDNQKAVVEESVQLVLESLDGR